MANSLTTTLSIATDPLAAATARALHPVSDLGLRPALRRSTDGAFITDNCNVILDCGVGPIVAPRALGAAIRAVPGVVDTGLFLGTATKVLVADGDGVRELTREGRR